MSIECAFGIFTSRWRLLKTALSNNIQVDKATTLLQCLAKLHNFCIDERLRDPMEKLGPIVPPRSNQDIMTTYDYKDAETPPVHFLDGGKHFDDCGESISSARKAAGARAGRAGTLQPRQRLLQMIINGGWKRYITNSEDDIVYH